MVVPFPPNCSLPEIFQYPFGIVFLHNVDDSYVHHRAPHFPETLLSSSKVPRDFKADPFLLTGVLDIPWKIVDSNKVELSIGSLEAFVCVAWTNFRRRRLH